MAKREVIALRKLTSKSIMGERSARPEAKEKHLYRIAGTAHSLQTGESDFGPWIAFKGNFSALRHDGKFYAAPKAFLPEPMQSMLESEILKASADGLTPAITFAVDVSIAQADTGVGYEYQCKPVIQAENESLSLLEISLKDKPIQLPPPAK